MKRSEINCALRKLEQMCKDYRFYLPPFCNLSPEDWKQAGHEYDEVRECMLGWDITDFGSGDFSKVGLSLITIRNGCRTNEKKYPKVYAEKIMYLDEGQPGVLIYIGGYIMGYTLGLDIGISSIGWAVLHNDSNDNPCHIEDLGVRIFEKAEQPKTGASLALPRRQARSTRRRLRRKRHRKERIKALIETSGVMKRGDMDLLFQNSGYEKDVYTLRAEGLDRCLSPDEWVRVLIHLAQRRGYRSNSTAETAKDKDTGKLKQAIAENASLMADKGYRTVGEMFCRDEKFQAVGADGKQWRKTRNTYGDYCFTVTRDMIHDEVQALFEAQRINGNLHADQKFQDEYAEILFSQRNFDEGPGGDSPYRKGDLRGHCTFERDELRAFKACYTFEYFKLLQDLNHIRIHAPNEEPRRLSQDERTALIELSKKSPDLTYARLRKALSLPEDATFNTVRYGEKSVDETEKKSKFPQMQSWHKLRKALDAVKKDYIQELSQDTLDEIGTILSLYKGDERRIAQLSALGLDDDVIQALLPLSFSKAGNLSLTAMKKLIPHLEKGINYDEACRGVYGDHRGHAGGKRSKTITLSPEFRESGALDAITNPVVLRAVSQTCKVVNAIIRRYGSPQLICVELARDMSKNFDDRIKAEKSNQDNRKRNDAALKEIEEIKGARATGLDIVKYKLWAEQDGTCLYSGTKLDSHRLFEPGYVDIDHIIPYSISFDDSYRNKVLVLSAENRQKGNRLPLEYMAGDEARIERYTTLVETTIRDFRKRQKLLKHSMTEDEKVGFKERNLVDTRYITRTVYNLFRDYLEFAPSKYEKKPVRAINGVVTDYMRKRFGLIKNREDGDLHHAMDAAVIATTTDGMINRISRYAQRRERGQKVMGRYVDLETGELMSQADFDEKYAPKFPEPWAGFRQELLDRLSPDPYEELMEHHIPNYDPADEVHPVFVSRMPNRKVTGTAHEATIRSAKVDGFAIEKVALTELKLDKNGEIEGYYNPGSDRPGSDRPGSDRPGSDRPGSDRLLYEALVQQLKLYKGDGKKAFTAPFYKPKKDGTPGPVVNKVKRIKPTNLNVSTCGGIAKNGSMVRIDVFYVKDDGYYFVPVYTADLVKAELPQRAVVAGKPHDQWKLMKDEDFIFSLYAGDMIHVVSSDQISVQLTNKNATGEPQLYRNEWYFYYVKAGIATASITATTHDRKYEKGSLGIKRLVLLDKYEVDPLGEYHRVAIPEHRQSFCKN